MASDKRMLIEIIYDDDKGTPVLKANQAALDQYGDQIKDIEKNLQNFSKKQKGAKSSVNATNLAMMDAGRILQDMPYGLRGVANNIDPMIQSFQRLKVQTGGSTQALKAMLGSLMGPAGFAIGVSAVTSLLVAFGPQIKDFFGSFREGSKDLEAAKKKMEAFGDEFKSQFTGISKDFTNEQRIEVAQQAMANLTEQMQALKIETEGYQVLLSDANQVFNQEQRNLIGDKLTEVSGRLNYLKNISPSVKASLEELITEYERAIQVQQALEDLGIVMSDEEREAARASYEGFKQTLPVAIEPEFEVLSDDITFEDILPEGSFDVGEKLGAEVIPGLTNSLRQYGYTLRDIKGLSPEVAQGMLEQAQAAEMLSNILTNQVVNGVAQTADMFGQLAADGLNGKELFGGFQMMMADFMSTFGKQLIALGIGKIGLDKLFQSVGGGPAAIAAGVALVAAAGAVRTSAQNRLGAITGSGTTANTLIGYRGVNVAGSSGSQVASFPNKVAVEFTDGTGNIVANGIMDLDRKGKSVYLGG